MTLFAVNWPRTLGVGIYICKQDPLPTFTNYRMVWFLFTTFRHSHSRASVLLFLDGNESGCIHRKTVTLWKRFLALGPSVHAKESGSQRVISHLPKVELDFSHSGTKLNPCHCVQVQHSPRYPLYQHSLWQTFLPNNNPDLVQAPVCPAQENHSA